MDIKDNNVKRELINLAELAKDILNINGILVVELMNSIFDIENVKDIFKLKSSVKTAIYNFNVTADGTFANVSKVNLFYLEDVFEKTNETLATFLSRIKNENENNLVIVSDLDVSISLNDRNVILKNLNKIVGSFNINILYLTKNMFFNINSENKNNKIVRLKSEKNDVGSFISELEFLYDIDLSHYKKMIEYVFSYYIDIEMFIKYRVRIQIVFHSIALFFKNYLNDSKYKVFYSKYKNMEELYIRSTIWKSAIFRVFPMEINDLNSYTNSVSRFKNKFNNNKRTFLDKIKDSVFFPFNNLINSSLNKSVSVDDLNSVFNENQIIEFDEFDRYAKFLLDIEDLLQNYNKNFSLNRRKFFNEYRNFSKIIFKHINSQTLEVIIDIINENIKESKDRNVFLTDFNDIFISGYKKICTEDDYIQIQSRIKENSISEGELIFQDSNNDYNNRFMFNYKNMYMESILSKKTAVEYKSIIDAILNEDNWTDYYDLNFIPLEILNKCVKDKTYEKIFDELIRVCSDSHKVEVFKKKYDIVKKYNSKDSDIFPKTDTLKRYSSDKYSYLKIYNSQDGIEFGDVSSLNDYLEKVLYLTSCYDTSTRFYYRGQKDYKNIECSLSRKFKEFGYDKDITIDQLEDFYIQKYKTVFPEIFNDENRLNTIIKLQHYGVPTRLIDVTSNFLVALYFACRFDNSKKYNIKKDMDGCVYIFYEHNTSNSISNSDIVNNSLEFYKIIKDEKVFYERYLYYKQIETYNKHYEKIKVDSLFYSNKLFYDKIKGKSNIIHIESPVKFNRLIAQHGSFYYSFDKYDENAESLEGNIGIVKKKPYIKLIIRKEYKNKILQDLERLNIKYETLFPDDIDKNISLMNEFKIELTNFHI